MWALRIIAMGCSNVVQIKTWVGASHGFVLRAHMNERTLLNHVMYHANTIYQSI
jgi:hypothetical protein